MKGAAIHADDTPVKVLTPGTGKTKTGRLWVYLRDESDYGGPAPPAAFYRYSPDQKGTRPQPHFKDYEGYLHADGYAGFEELYRSGRITEVSCMAHIRRKFFDIHAANASPIAKEALERIGALYRIEKAFKTKSLDERATIRQDQATPLFVDLQ